MITSEWQNFWTVIGEKRLDIGFATRHSRFVILLRNFPGFRAF